MSDRGRIIMSSAPDVLELIVEIVDPALIALGLVLALLGTGAHDASRTIFGATVYLGATINMQSRLIRRRLDACDLHSR